MYVSYVCPEADYEVVAHPMINAYGEKNWDDLTEEERKVSARKMEVRAIHSRIDRQWMDVMELMYCRFTPRW